MKNSMYNLYIRIVFLLFVSPQFIFALPIPGTTVSSTNNENNSLLVRENSYHKFSFSNYFTDFNHNTINTPEGLFTILSVDGYGKTNKIGSPELPVNVKIIEVPSGANVKVKIISQKFKEYKLEDLNINYPIYPLQAPVPKNASAQSVLVINEKVYNQDSFYPYDIVSVEDLGIMRGVRLSRLFISPIQYNPAKGIIRIYSEIETEIIFQHPDIAKSKLLKRDTESLYFHSVFKNIINYKSNSSKDTITKYPVKYVIISDPMFQAQLQPFIEWKTKKGFHVIEAYTNDPAVGTTADSIKDYLENLYFSGTPTDPAPTFVLLVGDYGQIPAKNGTTGYHITDLYFCEYTGDFLPEVFYGRFSANNIDQLQPQIDKTLEYEQYLMPDPSYLDRAALIAGIDGTHGPLEGNGQVNYASYYYIKQANGFAPAYFLYPTSGSQGAQIIQFVNNGACVVNYTGHGSAYGWDNPSFDKTDVATLTNNHKYPLMIGNACVTNSFGYQECFGEALLRAENAGAIGYIGASANSYWSEDFYWSVGAGAITANPTYAGSSLAAYDRTFHIYGEPYSEWFVTQAQMIYAGNLAVMTSGSSDWDYYWEIYHLMGDPSLMVYYTEPPAMSVSHASLIPVGASSFTVITEPYAYVGISMNGILHGAAPSDASGVAVVSLTPFVQAGTADVVVTKQNRQPYIDTVTVDFPGGPFLIMNQYLINDTNGNNNGEADFGELIVLDVELKNTGGSTSYATTATLSTADTNITITKNTHSWGDIPAFDSIKQNGAFILEVHELIPDQQKVYFNLAMQDTSGNSFNSLITITLNAPSLMIGNYFVDDQNGNNNGRLDPGETADIVIPTYNTGHCNADNAMAELLCVSGVVAVNNTTYDFNVLTSNSSQNAVFSVTVSTQIPIASNFELEYTVTSGVYQKHKSFFPFIGLVSEDWETGDLSRFSWAQSGNKPWIITNVDPYEGVYCAKSGTINNYEKSILSISFEVSNDDSISFFRKVSSEEDFDFLKFYIDDNLQDQWSGQKEWARMIYPVSAGFHTFKWTYEKDFGSTMGDDCGWIDLINFPPISSAAGVGNEMTDSDKLNFKAFPNPAKDILTISFNSSSNCKTSLIIYDNFGREIKQISESSGSNNRQNNISIDVREFKAGVYYAVLISGESRQAKKFIIID